MTQWTRLLRTAVPAAFAALLLVAPLANAATITILNADGAGEGFNDATPAVPVGGNPGLTIGQQRLNVFEQAASIWGSLLPSNVTIVVRAQFNPQSCNATSGVLGSAGPAEVWRDFANAPFPGTWYHVALANRLADFDLNPALQDINTTFNVSIGGATCLPQGWYYGFDGLEGTAIELLPVVLHELGHGLGFSTTTSGTTGNFLGGFPSVYDRFLFDSAAGLHWSDMTAVQRQASAIGCNKLGWDGPAVLYDAPSRLGPKPLLRVNGGGAAGDYEIGLAAFGGGLTSTGLTGDVVYVDDGVAPNGDGCETPYLNAGDLAGKIALIDRGLCTFAIKVKNAQDAGAIAVIIADNTAGCPPAGLGGADPTITIPSVRVTLPDGALLKANLVGLNVTLIVDPARKAGMNAAGHVLVFSPNPFQGGSSISHWDTSAEPSLLMEPAITGGLNSDVDLTLNHFSDIGWLDIAVPIAIAPGRAFAEAGRVRVEWTSSHALTNHWTAYRRTALSGWTALGSPNTIGDRTLYVEDTDVEAGTSYGYRLGTPVDGGSEQFSEEVWVRVPLNGGFTLEGARPNPATRNLRVAFTITRSGTGRLDLVDVTGRLVETVDLSSFGAGEHLVPLGSNRKLSPGTYFIRLTHGRETQSRPVVVVED
ncbi:MAG: PA domain-containing protein [Candidatus Eiseniibacteriota bacterium]